MLDRISVFIYGSLIPGFANHRVVAPYLLGAPRDGRVIGRLVDFGPYPALLRDREAYRRGSLIRGLWIAVSPEGLRSMDKLEDFRGIGENNDYERVWATDTDVPERRGWVYVWDSPRGCPEIPEDYWPDYMIRRMA
ncbi:gamma-glutamylcyclotransferase family protein [Paenibacillus humicola]|uniref:gamma-glutamylcyclotransferase family protein n=1 Tax=Paenibacillus humicola TaxID=3110540 RepID=UPI00237B3DEA|nr:gamma-glutamylcyclotransferase family protein [Paenibacillus humicola]